MQFKKKHTEIIKGHVEEKAIFTLIALIMNLKHYYL